MRNIPIGRLQNGMLCWVEEMQCYYQWANNKWSKFAVSSDVRKVNTLEELNAIDKSELDAGSLCYVRDEEMFYKCNASKQWEEFTQVIRVGQEVVIQSEEPEDHSVLWVDDSDSYKDELTLIDNVVIQELISTVTSLRLKYEEEIKALRQEVAELKKIVESGDFIVGDKYDYLVTEEGDYFITEDGDRFITEESSSSDIDSSKTYMITEDGLIMTTENGDRFITEDSK